MECGQGWLESGFADAEETRLYVHVAAANRARGYPMPAENLVLAWVENMVKWGNRTPRFKDHVCEYLPGFVLDARHLMYL
jgi:hypothetical protein